MNTMEAIARILKEEGVEWIACFPSNNLIEEVAKVGIRTIMFRQERGALMAADGYSRINDRKKFGVVITQGGARLRKQHGRPRAGIRGQHSYPVPARRLGGGADAGAPQLLARAHLCHGVQA